VEVIHSTGIDGARQARGIAVVIDVIRSFSVSAYALAGGARECRLVKTTDEARALAASIPGALISAEENTLPIAGIAISLRGRLPQLGHFSSVASVYDWTAEKV
jgi:2-phosphosulfolactate phosphatase